MSGRWSGGKGDRTRPMNRKKWDENYARAFGDNKMNRSRYTPRLCGAGRQIMKQVLEKNLIRVIMTPLLREKIRGEFDCTNADIDKAMQAGITEFGDDFKKLMAEQRAMLKPPKETCPVCGNAQVIDSGGQDINGNWIDVPCPHCTKPGGHR